MKNIYIIEHTEKLKEFPYGVIYKSVICADTKKEAIQIVKDSFNNVRSIKVQKVNTNFSGIADYNLLYNKYE